MPATSNSIVSLKQIPRCSPCRLVDKHSRGTLKCYSSEPVCLYKSAEHLKEPSLERVSFIFAAAEPGFLGYSWENNRRTSFGIGRATML